jgi:hypothetical protein
MKTIEDAKDFLRFCNAKMLSTSYYDYLNIEICTGVCCECTTRRTLKWVWPELEDFREATSKEELYKIYESDMLRLGMILNEDGELDYPQEHYLNNEKVK